MASAPAGVDKLPLAVVDAYGVPCVAGCVFRGAWPTWFGRVVAVAFAVTAHDHSLQACALGDGMEDPGVAFADGLAAEDHLAGALSARDAIVEEAIDVVGDVVVLPGEDGAGLVGGRGEGIAEDVGEVTDWVLSGEGVQRVLGRDVVRPGEITASEARVSDGGRGSRGYGVDLVGRWAGG